ncbi:DNA-binding transcriptional LysR family regulator [Mesorhizobium soli]|uniref:LysR family transcriptional regulator n=1 Tax=Pseudaminobacter soli (ex Li et al. 2025) TaxID=1295366 RepID=UPI0024746619|nr:LysR family transcriptional regulator [Mesorhizobium soli]MDH6234186.1 DNA-binding transcriptional LysR family regulator [Mesorhizobium soli]
MIYSLSQLRYAVAAARHESISAAARELNVSQPSISVAISQIEERTGQKLFVRQRGAGIALTPFGQAFMLKAKVVLDDVDDLDALVRGKAAVGGEVVLGCFQDLAPHFAPALIRRMAELHPGVRISVSEERFETLEKRLGDAAVDIALTYDLGLPINAERVLLSELAPHALLAASHPLSRQERVSLAELAREPLIVTDQPYSWQHMLDLFRAFGHAPAVAAKTRSFELQRSMVANGFGVAISYTRPAVNRSYDGQRLVCRPLSEPVPLQRIIIAHDARQRLSKAASAFIEVAREWFSKREPFSTVADGS